MMRQLFFALFVFLLPQMSWAQVLPVRSGEHEGFTRLVIDMPAVLEWQLEERDQESQFRLSFPDRTVTFDTAAVFQRIGTNRLSSIQNAPRSGSLDLELACACGISAYLVDDAMLVLDIAERAESSEPQKVIGDTTAFSQVTLTGVPSLGPRVSRPRDRGWLQVPLDIPSGEENAAFGSLEQHIADNLASATARGLLSAANIGLPPSREPHVARTGTTEPHVPAPPLHQGPETEPKSVPTAASVLETPQGEKRIRLNATPCVPDDQLDIKDWARQGDPFDQIGSHRVRLVEEFDALNEDIVYDLAKLYLHYGFGAEAAATLSLAEQSNKRRIFESMALILDHRTDRHASFHGQLFCDTSASMWSLLSVNDALQPEDVNTAAVTRAFEELPLHLKALLAARISGALLKLDESDASVRILSRARRSINGPNSEIALAEVRNDAVQGMNVDVFDRFTSLARTSGSVVSSEALESAVTFAAANDEPLAQDLVELASAYATEYRGTEEAVKKWRAHLRALLRNGAMDAALSEISNARHIDLSDRSAMKTEVFQALVDRASDEDFLWHALTDLRVSEVAVAKETRLAAAGRFLKLGLPQEALSTLEMSPDGFADRETRQLRARIYLALFQPEDAEIALIGLQGEKVETLRADARMQMGDYEFARSSYDALGRTVAAERAAWIGGDWSRVAESGSETFAPVADMIQSEQGGLDNPADVSLARSNAILEQSAAARGTLRALLDDTRIQNNFQD